MNELPSRFQIGDSVSFFGRSAVVTCVHFEAAKVSYTVMDCRGIDHFTPSEHVHPESAMLKAVK